MWPWLCRLAARRNPHALVLLARLAAGLWLTGVLAGLRALAASPDMREQAVAAAAVAATVAEAPAPALAVLEEWAADPFPSVRAVLADALTPAARDRLLPAARLLDVAERLAADPVPPVGAHLGHFLLGQGLAVGYPDETIQWLERRAAEPRLRKVVAMALSESLAQAAPDRVQAMRSALDHAAAESGGYSS